MAIASATDPLFLVGDEHYTFDRIGNMKNMQRHGFFTTTPTDVEQLIWSYNYHLGKSRLAQVLAIACWGGATYFRSFSAT